MTVYSTRCSISPPPKKKKKTIADFDSLVKHIVWNNWFCCPNSDPKLLYMSLNSKPVFKRMVWENQCARWVLLINLSTPPVIRVSELQLPSSTRIHRFLWEQCYSVLRSRNMSKRWLLPVCLILSVTNVTEPASWLTGTEWSRQVPMSGVYPGQVVWLQAAGY